MPAFDLLTGHAGARERILQGDPAREVANAVAAVDRADRAIVEEAVAAAEKRRL